MPNIIFKSQDSLAPVTNLLAEAATALSEPARTIRESSIPEALAGAISAGVGSAASFGLLYGLGTAGLSAAGITSGLATAGAIVGGGMAAGVVVLAAPAAVLGVAGYGIASHFKHKKLRLLKESIYQQAIEKHQAIIEALEREVDATKERLDYLNGLNILLQKAIADLKTDLDSTK